MSQEIEALGRVKEFAAKYTSAQASVTVEAAPTPATVRFVIDFLLVGGDAPGTLQIKDSDGTDVGGYFFPFGANGGVIIEKAYLKKIPLGKGIRFTTTGGGNHSVILKYHLEAQGDL